MLNYMETGKKVKLLRQILGMGQKEFSEKLEISQAQLSKIEADKQELTARGLYILQSEFKIDPDWLFGRIESSLPVFLNKKESDQQSEIEELRQKLLHTQEQLIEYKTRENEKLKNNQTTFS